MTTVLTRMYVGQSYRSSNFKPLIVVSIVYYLNEKNLGLLAFQTYRSQWGCTG